jgi:hypothetical protein
LNRSGVFALVRHHGRKHSSLAPPLVNSCFRSVQPWLAEQAQ